MKNQLVLFTAASLLALPALQAQTTGTSHPEALDDNITVSQPAKPLPVVPMTAPALQTHQRAGEVVQATVSSTPTVVPAAIASTSSVAANNEDAGVIIDVPSAANQLPQGTLVRVKLGEEISTREPEQPSRFSAVTSQPILKNGRTVIPAGSVLTGRITELASGHHLRRSAAIHLQPEFITLPDGAHYKFVGQVIDLNSTNHAHVSSEGTILGNDQAKGIETSVAVSTGAGALTGAALGGGVGAVVGAGIGAGVSGAVWANQPTSNTLHAGTLIIFALNEPMLLENVPMTN